MIKKKGRNEGIKEKEGNEKRKKEINKGRKKEGKEGRKEVREK